MKIGFIGLGIMGESMCENIIKKHDDKVYIYDLVRSQVDKLANLGGIPCESCREVAKNADVIITMVPKSEHSKTVYSDILEVLDGEKLCIDMSTIHPSVSVEISNMVKKTGAEFIDAPVVKSKPAAIAGVLGIYVGGSEIAYLIAKPILEYMGNNIIRMGDNGKGLVMKICHNALVSQIQNGVNETIAIAKKQGIAVSEFAKAVSYGGGQNFYLDGKASAIESENFATAFSVENMAKDIDICVELAKECDVFVGGVLNAKDVYDRALSDGLAKEDFSATIKTVIKGK
ncbi:MAG: NAD(P)-dependent oxidoreductase [Bacillota bacterium]